MKNLIYLTAFLLAPLSIFAQSPGGEPTVPIDNYTYILIGLAMLIIGYVAYKKKQVKTA